MICAIQIWILPTLSPLIVGQWAIYRLKKQRRAHSPRRTFRESTIPSGRFRLRWVRPISRRRMMGSRAIVKYALTPFPNLDIQSGPCEVSTPLVASCRGGSTVPHSRTLEFQTAPGVVQNNGDAKYDNETAYGWYNSLLMSAPFWKEKGIGVQFGSLLSRRPIPRFSLRWGPVRFARCVGQ